MITTIQIIAGFGIGLMVDRDYRRSAWAWLAFDAFLLFAICELPKLHP